MTVEEIKKSQGAIKNLEKEISDLRSSLNPADTGCKLNV